MARKPKFPTLELAKVLEQRGLKADVFNNGMHMRVVGIGVSIDLWPTTGRWKWMNERSTGTLDDFARYLDTHRERVAAFARVFNNRS